MIFEIDPATAFQICQRRQQHEDEMFQWLAVTTKLAFFMAEVVPAMAGHIPFVEVGPFYVSV